MGLATQTIYILCGVGGVIGVALFLVVIFCILSRRKKKPLLSTLSYYLAISRSSCEAHILDLPLTLPPTKAKAKNKAVNIHDMGWEESQTTKRRKKVSLIMSTIYRHSMMLN